MLRPSNPKRLFLKLFVIIMSGLIFAVLRMGQLNNGSDRQRRSVSDLLPQDYSKDLPACSAIINGDLEGLDQNKLGQLLASKKRSKVLSEAFYLNVTQDCVAYVKNRGFITVPLSVEERDFPIAYSMVIHNQIEMFERLLRAVYAPQNVYCVHLDSKSSQEFKNAVEAIVSCMPNVFVASKMVSVVYASWSRVQADLNCMEDLLNSTVQWRYLLNTCGTDFPIKTNLEMVQALQLLQGKNSMESEITSESKKGRWQYIHKVTDTVIRTAVRKTPPPIDTPMFSGNAYFVVTRDFVQHVIENPKVKALIEWEKDTYSPDEHLWATLQRMPSVPGSNPPASKYQQSDMNSIARLVKWSYHAGDLKQGAPYAHCAGDYRRAVCVYGAGDLRWLFQNHHLIANKFDPLVDDVAIRCLESFLCFKARRQSLSVEHNSRLHRF